MDKSKMAALIQAVDMLLNMDWENTVMIECPEDVDAVGILNGLQEARDAIDGKPFYASKVNP